MNTLAQSSIWWLLAGGAVAIELLTGTFYLLMIAVGLAAAAIAAHLGFGLPPQMVIAAVAGGGSVLILRAVRGKRVHPAQASENRDVNLDIGETVHVGAWQLDGTAFVTYRGARWSVALRPGAAATSGTHRIVEVVGNRLIVDKV
jgi:membrane protein implicated in regulation of membrane protease activity